MANKQPLNRNLPGPTPDLAPGIYLSPLQNPTWNLPGPTSDSRNLPGPAPVLANPNLPVPSRHLPAPDSEPRPEFACPHVCSCPHVCTPGPAWLHACLTWNQPGPTPDLVTRICLSPASGEPEFACPQPESACPRLRTPPGICLSPRLIPLLATFVNGAESLDMLVSRELGFGRLVPSARQRLPRQAPPTT